LPLRADFTWNEFKKSTELNPFVKIFTLKVDLKSYHRFMTLISPADLSYSRSTFARLGAGLFIWMGVLYLKVVVNFVAMIEWLFDHPVLLLTAGCAV